MQKGPKNGYAYHSHGPLVSDVKKFCESCESCQKRARITCWDRVPTTPVPMAEAPFTHWFMDCLGPIFNHKVDFNYCLILVDSATRWPAAFPLPSLTAKCVCDSLLQLWMNIYRHSNSNF